MHGAHRHHRPVTDDAGDGWHASGWTMHLDAADALSGIATVEHSIDGGAWQSGAEHDFTLAQRSNTGRVYAVEYTGATDAAGNVTGGSCAALIDSN